MRGLLFRWVVIFLAVFVMAALLPGRIVYQDWESVAVFAGILSLLNAFLRPILNLLALPLTCLTLGLFAIVINGFVFWLATRIFPGVTVASFLDAIIAAVIVSFVSAIMGWLGKK
ncbi:MAG: phage holin family protein [Dehalococcoidales bacterium]|nr:phage holin family protein [Dehalococcoidales bacterium]